MERLSSGNSALDEFLGGGFEKEVVTTVYGPSGSGKTLLLMLAMTQAKNTIIYVDTEGGFSTERFRQVCPNADEVLSRTVFLNPTAFKEQNEAIEEVKRLTKNNISLVIVDTLTALYRVEMSGDDNYDLNKTLARQMHDLVEIARKRKIPVLVTTQVYANLETGGLKLVGGRTVKNMSKCLMMITEEGKLKIMKHRSQPEGKEADFEITSTGLTLL